MAAHDVAQINGGHFGQKACLGDGFGTGEGLRLRLFALVFALALLPVATADYVEFTGEVGLDDCVQATVNVDSSPDARIQMGGDCAPEDFDSDQPPQPQELTATGTQGGVNLTWIAPGNAAYTYNVYRNGVPVATGITGTTWRDEAPLPAAIYYATTQDGAMESQPSNLAGWPAPLGCPLGRLTILHSPPFLDVIIYWECIPIGNPSNPPVRVLSPLGK